MRPAAHAFLVGGGEIWPEHPSSRAGQPGPKGGLPVVAPPAGLVDEMTIAEGADQLEHAAARIGLRNSGQHGIVSSRLERDREAVGFHSRAADLRLLVPPKFR